MYYLAVAIQLLTARYRGYQIDKIVQTDGLYVT